MCFNDGKNVHFQLRLEQQATILNGSRIENARFGSAISSIGDINKDGFNGTDVTRLKICY